MRVCADVASWVEADFTISFTERCRAARVVFSAEELARRERSDMSRAMMVCRGFDCVGGGSDADDEGDGRS